jgi:hypothetical protein
MSIVSGVMRRIAGAAYARATFRTNSIRKAQRRLDTLAARGSRFLVCIPYLKSGGAERVASNLTHALAHLYGPESVAVLVTDWSGLIVRLIFPENSPNSYPSGVKFTDIVSLGRASYDERVWDVMTSLLSMRPQMVLNVNSQLTLQDYYGACRPVLSLMSERVFQIQIAVPRDPRDHFPIQLSRH